MRVRACVSVCVHVCVRALCVRACEMSTLSVCLQDIISCVVNVLANIRHFGCKAVYLISHERQGFSSGHSTCTRTIM